MSARAILVDVDDEGLKRLLDELGVLRVPHSADARDIDLLVLGPPWADGDLTRRLASADLVVTTDASRTPEARIAARALGAEILQLPVVADRARAVIRRILARRERRFAIGKVLDRLRAVDETLARDVERLARERDEAERAAEEAAIFRNAVIANLSHEIRTPVTILEGLLAVLGEELSDRIEPDQLDLLERVRLAAIRLVRVVESLLDLAKAEAGLLEARSERIFLPELVREITGPVRELLSGTRVRLAVDVPRALEWVTTDAALLRQILAHLLSNAVKFTAEGEVRVEARLVGTAPSSATEDPAHLLRATAPTGDILEIAVADTGVGIPPERREQVFEAFLQADVSATRAFEGVGVGLSIVREACRALGASIDLRSEPGAGTRITVRIPLVTPAGAIVEAALTPAAIRLGREEAAGPIEELSTLFLTRPRSEEEASHFALDALDRLLHPDGVLYANREGTGWRIRAALGPELAPGMPVPLAPDRLRLAAAERRPLRGEGDEWTVLGLRLGGNDAADAVLACRPCRTDAGLRLLQIVGGWLSLQGGRAREADGRAAWARALARDVKGPLGAAIGYSQVLLRGLQGELSDEQRTVVLRLERATHAAIHAALDLVELERARSTGLEPRSESFSLPAVVEHVLSRSSASLILAQVRVSTQVPDSLPPCLGDEPRTDRALSALLRACLPLVPEGGEIRLSLAAEASSVECALQAPLPEGSSLHRALGTDVPLQADDLLPIVLARRWIEAQGGSVALEASGSIRITLPRA